MKTMLYVWFDICNFITRFIVKPLVFLLLLVPKLIEAGIYILGSIRKREEVMKPEEWYYNYSKVWKIHMRMLDFFRPIEY